MFVVVSMSKLNAQTMGAFKDSRDGKTYKTIKISTQTWMAENLNYEISNSWCYKNNSSNCEKYGRLYTWNAAKKSCPVGWHLPSDAEWTKLINSLGGETMAGKRLKSASGWKLFVGKNYGNNESGFDALPGGYHANYNGSFIDIGEYGHWWSSTLDGVEKAWGIYLFYGYAGVYRSHDYCKNGVSVRCLKD